MDRPAVDRRGIGERVARERCSAGFPPRGEGQSFVGNKKRTIRKRVKHRLKRLGAWAIAVSYQIHLWCVWRTARIEVVGCDRLFETLRRHDRAALAIWHENLIMSIYGLRECKPPTLASKSDIGDVIATVLKRNNFHVFRGGSSRGKSRRSPAPEKI